MSDAARPPAARTRHDPVATRLRRRRAPPGAFRRLVLPLLSELCGDRHFLAAAVILAVTAAGWSMTINLLKWATFKESVPWPRDVQVSEDFRWVNLSDRMGPFVLARDGELEKNADGTPKLDGRSDGDVILTEDVTEMLRIGTGFDKTRFAERRSNWYNVRFYRDSRPASARRYWRLEVYYYTGGLDKVPHVPERCLIAGGARLLETRGVEFQAPKAPPCWQGAKFNRTRYEYRDYSDDTLRQAVQYYTFSLNGRPEDSWKRVRLTLTYPWVRHCYFAKIQFAPWGEASDPEGTDIEAAEFVKEVLPNVLRGLPTSEDVDLLRRAS